MKTMKPKAKKPRNTKQFYLVSDCFGDDAICIYDRDGWNAQISMREAKRLHEFIGQAIAYLEAKEGK